MEFSAAHHGSIVILYEDIHSNKEVPQLVRMHSLDMNVLVSIALLSDIYTALA